MLLYYFMSVVIFIAFIVDLVIIFNHEFNLDTIRSRFEGGQSMMPSPFLRLMSNSMLSGEIPSGSSHYGTCTPEKTVRLQIKDHVFYEMHHAKLLKFMQTSYNTTDVDKRNMFYNFEANILDSIDDVKNKMLEETKKKHKYGLNRDLDSGLKQIMTDMKKSKLYENIRRENRWTDSDGKNFLIILEVKYAKTLEEIQSEHGDGVDDKNQCLKLFSSCCRSGSKCKETYEKASMKGDIKECEALTSGCPLTGPSCKAAFESLSSEKNKECTNMASGCSRTGDNCKRAAKNRKSC